MHADWLKIMFLQLDRNTELEIENNCSVFQSRYRNASRSLREVEKAVETLACQLVFTRHFSFSKLVFLNIRNIWWLFALGHLQLTTLRERCVPRCCRFTSTRWCRFTFTRRCRFTSTRWCRFHQKVQIYIHEFYNINKYIY